MSDVVAAAFGAKNRARLIATYFLEQAHERKPWEHVYRLLLWVDHRSGLAHCYESDKSQPGKNWYERSLAFHAWLGEAFRVAPTAVAQEIDWLFRRATTDLAGAVLARERSLSERGERVRLDFAGREMPRPGQDPQLIAILHEVLGSRLPDTLPSEVNQVLVQRIWQHLSLDNKRKNLVGEGFEDVIAEVVARGTPKGMLNVRARVALHDLPGFNRQRARDKANKVDVSIVSPSGRRTLVTAKWSVRADREKQFAADFREYNAAESNSERFDYVFVTNEFDPARLVRACDHLEQNSEMFTHVVHVNPDALRATYNAKNGKGTMGEVLQRINSGRLIGIDDWLARVVS